LASRSYKLEPGRRRIARMYPKRIVGTFPLGNWPSLLDSVKDLPERRSVVLIGAVCIDSSSNCKFLNSFDVLSQLAKNFPPQFNEQLTALCTQYSDVFGLETESITTNNFYKQKLRLVDDEPVYIKNYRNPHSQQDEIQKQVKKLINDEIVEPSVSPFVSTKKVTSKFGK